MGRPAQWDELAPGSGGGQGPGAAWLPSGGPKSYPRFAWTGLWASRHETLGTPGQVGSRVAGEFLGKGAFPCPVFVNVGRAQL